MANVASMWALIRSPFASLLDDRALLVRARSGDEAAFRHLFDRHAPAIHRFLCDLFGDEALADEATQETFVRAYQKLGSVKDEDRLMPWLFGIARLVSFEARRNRVRHPEQPLDETDEAADPELTTHDTPETLLLSREAGAHLDAALKKLSADRRTVLLLRADHGLSYDDIARVLSWSLPKVKVELHRARAQLRTLLAGGAR